MVKKDKHYDKLEKIDPKEHPGLQDLKIMWHSVAPHIRSGYGTVTRHVASRLHKLGYYIIVSAYYGIEQGGVLLIDGMPVIPCSRQGGSFGRVSALQHAKSFKTNAQILMSDYWAFPWFPQEMPDPILHSPMDHTNYPEELLRMIRQYKKIISLCNWQQEQLRKVGIESPVIYHGVDTDTYFPMKQREARAITRIPEDQFVIGIVSANADKEGRKGWSQMFKGVKLFLDNNPDVRDLRIFVHSNPEDPRGLPLKNMAHKQGILEICAFESPHLSVIGLNDEQMNILYNSFDLLMCCSYREGFGIPMLEAMATGKPVIAHDFSSMSELVKGRGWLVKTDTYVDTPINATTGIPDWRDIATQIEKAYNNQRQIKKYGRKALKFAKKHTWDRLVMNKWIPILDDIAIEMKKKPTAKKITI